MRARCLAFVGVLDLLFIIFTPVSAEIPQLINFQGKVTDSGGIPLADGTYSMTFSIYDVSSGGSSLWSSGASSVAVTDGVFSVLLGQSPQPALTLAFDSDYWVEIHIEGDIQSPRMRLGSVGYAYMASGLVAGTEIEGSVESGNLAVISGTNTSTESAARGLYGSASGATSRGVEGWATSMTGYTFGGRFESQSTDGRGLLGHASATTGTTYGVRGTCSSTAGTAVYGRAMATEGITYGVYGETNSTDGYAGYFNGKGYFNGNVGIGTESPDRSLSVVGYIRSANAADEIEYVEMFHGGGNGFINWSGDGNFNIRYGSDTKVTVQQDGDLGIGTTNPGAKLDVRGSAIFNENGADYDMRVEGDAQQYLFFVDGGDNRVGIATGAPNARLDVRGDAIFNEDGGYYDFRVEGNSQEHLIFADASYDVVGIGTATPETRLDVTGDIQAKGPAGTRRCRLSAGNAGGSGSLTIWGNNGNANFTASHTGPTLLDYGQAAVADSNGINKAGMYVNAAGNGIVYGDTKNFRMANPEDPGTEIWYACIEGPEAAAYLRGTARLENGRASISFPDHFQAVATEQGMTVQLTPRSPDSEGLALVRQSNEGFEIRELRNGRGSYEFDFLVMAVRKGYEDYHVIRPVDNEGIERLPGSDMSAG